MLSRAATLRIMTGAFLSLITVVPLFYLRQSAWGILIGFFLILASYEFVRLARFSQIISWIFFLAIGLSLAFLLVFVQSGSHGAIAKLHFFIAFTSFFFWVFLVPLSLRYGLIIKSSVRDIFVGMVMLVPAWFTLVVFKDNAFEILIVLGGICLIDISSYVGGKSFGRVRLADKLSSGKTVEGAICGAVSIVLYFAILNEFVFNDLSFLFIFVSALVFFALAVVGDLFESLLKRRAKVKDSGTLLPGHGGVLDRIDSSISVLPFFVPFLVNLG